MAKINWTDEAYLWLKDIYRYIAIDNQAAAQKTVNAIFKKAQILKKIPETGYRIYLIPNRHIRVLLYGHYRITYLIKPDKNIDILGVFHGALEIDKYL